MPTGCLQREQSLKWQFIKVLEADMKPAFSPKGSLRIAPTGSLKWCGENAENDRLGGLFNLQKVNKSQALTLNHRVAYPTHGAPNMQPGRVPGCNDHVCPSEQLRISILDWMKEKTATYKHPRIIEFVTSLPKTISGKIRRVEIRENDSQKTEN